MVNNTMLLAMDNKTMLIVLMIVLIAFIVLLTVLGIVFIIALRKRAPVIKVVMAPPAKENDEPEEEQEEETVQQLEIPAQPELAVENVVPPVIPEEDDDDDEEDKSVYVTENEERVRYDRSLTAKICQLKDETKGWYTELKNELLSYEKIKSRMSWKRESFRLGRMNLARIIVRGKTLCLLVAVEPAGYAGTKYTVEDVSGNASTADTPTLFRIKSARRLKYAKEMIAGIMKELKVFKNTHYEAQDFFMPYKGDMTLLQSGLIKRVVSNSSRTFEIREIEDTEVVDIPAGDNADSGEQPEDKMKEVV